MKDRWPAALVAIGVSAGVLAAPKAASANDAALAEQLYELGRKLMGERRVAEACPRFAESHRLDPATGTLLNLATCHEAEGKLATAWAEFKAGEAASHRDGREDREQYARLHIAALEPRLSYVAVAVPEASRLPELEVRLDGNLLGPAAWDVPVPVDPGAHEVLARAAGRVPFAARVNVDERARRHVVAVAFASPQVAPVPSPEISVAAAASEPRTEAEGPSPARTAGYVVGAVSIVALGAGVAFGLRAKSKWDARNSGGLCDANDVCKQPGLDYGSQAQTAATLSTVGFVAGALGAVTASYLLWISRDAGPSRTASRVQLTPTASARAGGLMLEGVW